MSALNLIMASAGSGKTHTLTEQYLALLLQCAGADGADAAKAGFHPACSSAPDLPVTLGDILAITFTNAAAEEMRDRIIGTLKKTALGIETRMGVAGLDRERAERWLDAILRDFGSLNIRTIDSLLLRIVHAAALELGLHPDFEPVFTAAEALEPTLDRFMEKAWLGDAKARDSIRQLCRDIVEHKDFKGFCDNNAMLSALEAMLEPVFLRLLDGLTPPETLRQRLDNVESGAVAAGEAFLAALEAAGVSHKLKAHARTALARLVSQQFSELSYTYLTKEGCQDLLTKGAAVTEEMESLYGDLRGKAERLARESALLREALGNYWFVEVTRQLVEGFMGDMRREGKLPTLLVPGKAKDVMGGEYGVPDIICRLGNRFAHFLLDEFQDTNSIQWDAMKPLVEEALSRGGSLTCVGDLKQSIYAWRGADSDIFAKVAEDTDLTCMVGEPSRRNLEYNFRSSRRIIEFNNGIFGAICGDGVAEVIMRELIGKDVPDDVVGEQAETLRGNFEGCAQTPSGKAKAEGFVRVETLEGDNAAEREALLLDRMCDLLKGEVHPRREWKDVLVLVRTNKQAGSISQRLINAEIPVVTENSLLLGRHTLVQQLVAFLRFLDDPGDDIACLAVLRGSIVLGYLDVMGISLEDIEECAAGRDAETRETLSGRFRDRWPDAWDRLLAPFQEKAHLMSSYDMVQEWVKRFDVEGRFPDARPFVRRFLEILFRAEDQGVASISEFLQQWQRICGEEKLPMPESVNAVRIMTIHKAKGLESPVVIVADTNFTTKDETRPQLREYDGMRLVVTRPSLLEPELRFAHLGKQVRENMNLLYVAFTRAKEELHIFRGRTSRQAAGVGDVIPLLADKAGIPEEDLARGLGEMPDGAPPSAVGEDESQEEVAFDGKLSAGWYPMSWMPRLRIARNPVQAPVLGRQDRRKLLGECLKCLTATGDPARDASLALDVGLGNVSSIESDAALEKEILDALTWFAGRPEAGWLVTGSPDHQLLMADGTFSTVDLLVRESWGTLLVCYETGGPEESHLSWMRQRLACLPQGRDATALGVLVYFSLGRFRIVSSRAASPLLDGCGSLPLVPRPTDDNGGMLQ